MHNIFWENVFNASKESLPIIIHPTHPNKEKVEEINILLLLNF